MLGLGHNPKSVLDAMSTSFPMANIMTSSIEQFEFAKILMESLGMSRSSPIYTKFLCMNSGSESVTVASRISDTLARKYAHKRLKFCLSKVVFMEGR